jgi:hypothetical protein
VSGGNNGVLEVFMETEKSMEGYIYSQMLRAGELMSRMREMTIGERGSFYIRIARGS